MTSPIADGVMAATHKLVHQAMTGQWQEVPKTVEERRVLLDQLSATARPQDQLWLSALKQAMAESDAVVEQMRRDVPNATLVHEAGQGMQEGESSLVDDMLAMIKGGR